LPQVPLTPRPPMSVITNGVNGSVSGTGEQPSSSGVNVDDIFQAETGLDDDDDDDDLDGQSSSRFSGGADTI